MWTDDFKKISYISLTTHYIDDEWILNANLLITSQFDENKKTGLNIRKELLRKYVKIGLDKDCFKNIKFVTDQGANMIRAFEE